MIPDCAVNLEALSDDVRLASRLHNAYLGAWQQSDRAWIIPRDGTRFRPPGGSFVSLLNRRPLAGILAGLLLQRFTDARSLPRAALVEAGWPGERMRPASARNRLNVALSTLRKLGLAVLLDSTPDGHRLDPGAAILIVAP